MSDSNELVSALPINWAITVHILTADVELDVVSVKLVQSLASTGFAAAGELGYVFVTSPYSYFNIDFIPFSTE